MCGIFGISVGPKSNISTKLLRELWEQLFLLSESRGKEAAGVCIVTNEVNVYKSAVSAKEFLSRKEYKLLLKQGLNRTYQNDQIVQPLTMFGHSRLVTNGIQGIHNNNQPIIRDDIALVHNGIVVNVEQLWAKYKDEAQAITNLDSEIICYLLRKALSHTKDLEKAIKETFNEIYGMTSIAAVFKEMPYLLIATNNGSLYFYYEESLDLFFFASEEFIINSVIQMLPESLRVGQSKHLAANETCMLNLETLKANFFSMNDANSNTTQIQIKTNKTNIFDVSNAAFDARENMRRCSRCILPETMPFIYFDEQGVCPYCNNYKKIEYAGFEALTQRATPFKKKNGKSDCIVAFSGGRDSSYGLHYIVTELGMKPVAYTYDWGMVTDLARRNQSRLCGKLGIEHILVSADINKKRKYIRKNVLAWLRKPELGMVPLFMAGDKQYLTYPIEIRKKTDTELVFYCGNQMEKTGFKTGFCGLDEAGKWYFQMSKKDKFKLSLYYLKQYMGNPAYLNSSLIDTAIGFYASFIVDRSNYVQLYNYIPWDEQKMINTLRSEYDWEFAGDTDSSWRIGDGTAAFYNYIYYTIAGFSENDTFRSNQIREGLISREEGLRLAKQDNSPRYDSIQEYAHIIGFDCSEALRIIDSVPKLYMKD